MTNAAHQPRRGPNGVTLIIAATAVAGIAGYLVTFVVFRITGAAAYATFAVFWAALYLVVGALSGIQQEIARATHRVEAGKARASASARNFGLVTAVLVMVAVVASSPLWSSAAFGPQGFALAMPLAVGTACYVLVAVLSGSLYGVAQWRSLAAMVALDGLLRLVLTIIALLFTHDIVALAWVVALPFPLVIVLLWRFIRHGLVGHVELDVPYGRLSWNVTRTVVASASTAVLVSGFPLLLGIAGASQRKALVGTVIFAITLTRAPLIVTVMALQSYFVVRFRDNSSTWLREFLRVAAIIIAAGIVLGVLGWLIGKPVLGIVSGSAVPIDGAFIAVLVISSACVALLSLSGSAVLALSQHLAYTAGWLAAAVATIVVMALPLAFLVKVEIALVSGPLVGLIIHFIFLGVHVLRRRQAPAIGMSRDA